MKLSKYFTSISIAVIIALIALCARLSNHARKLIVENTVLTHNNETLLFGFQTYKVRDSLNAATIGELTLDLETYKTYHEEDLNLINSLKNKNQALQKAAHTTLLTHDTLNLIVHDSIFRTDTLHCLSYTDPHLTFNGCISNNLFNGTISSRVNLHLIETVKYKKFLFFKTHKVKSRQFSCVTDNPHTSIEDFQVITIKQ